MHQEHAAISLETRKPVLEISQYPAMAQMGYKKPADAVSEQAQLGKQKAMEYIANKTDEGNRLNAKENGGKHRQGGYTPVVGPEFQATPGEVIITPPVVTNPSHIGYEGEYIPGELSIQYSAAKVEVYMRQYPEINIDVSV